ncbi:hypothetical protein K7X08_017851 [Anisodus acutangulus]|uniref:Uncharacterized protein n=1 Tax=Anisodus acutangulus TaxID=402998 RepID=A0A9Q1LZ92_9SOLA|nr:hypothetical protein K7X08_017851 [Anisodus acutangulus]
MGKSAWNELVLQSQQGSSVSRRTHFMLHSKQGHSQFPSKRMGHAILGTKYEQLYLNGMYARGQVYKDTKINPVDFTEPFMKKLDKPFIFDNVEEDGEKTLDLNLKL